jgi:hypothetical protein
VPFRIPPDGERTCRLPVWLGRRPQPVLQRSWWLDLTRSSGDENAVDDVELGGGTVTANAGEDPFGSCPPDSGGVLRDDGDSGVERRGERDVVESDQRDVVLSSRVVQRLDRTDGDQVLTGEKRIRRVPGGQQLKSGVSRRVRRS